MSQRGQSRSLGPLVIILATLLIASGIYMTREGKWGEVFEKLGLVSEKEILILELEAGVGEVINQFPIELLTLVNDAEIKESARYSLEEPGDPAREVMLTTTYTTRASISDLFAVYVDYMNNHGYAISKTESFTGSSKLEATNSKQTILVRARAISGGLKEVRVDIWLPKSAIEP